MEKDDNDDDDDDSWVTKLRLFEPNTGFMKRLAVR
jgi:hypothetical protein